MKIATGQPATPYGSMSGPIDGVVRYRGRLTHAERKHRQIIAAIECCETPGEVNDTLQDHDMEIDAMMLECPDYAEAIKEAADDHKAILMHGTSHAEDAGAPAPITATAQTTEPKTKENTMFAIDTGNDGGSKGPWMSWTSNGSAMKGFAPKSWVLRGKDENDEKFEHVIPAFANGCVLDLDTLQLGWMKDGATGQAPEKRWNPTVSQATPRPDDSKKPSGAYSWSAALSIRCAIGEGRAATWEQAAFGAYDAFSKLAKQISAEWPEKSQNGALLPLVAQTGVESQTLSGGVSNKPVLAIKQWVPRPDCLKADAPVIAVAAEPAPTTEQAVQAATANADASSVPAEVSF